MRNTSITTNGMLADTPDEKKPLSGWYFTQSCCSSPTPMRAGERERQAGHPADHDRGERADEQEGELELVRGRRSVTSSTPAKPASITPTIHEPAVTASVLTPAIAGVARVVDGHPRGQPDRREAQHERGHDRDHGRAHDHRELVLVDVGAEHLEEVRIGRALDTRPSRVEDLGRCDAGR